MAKVTVRHDRLSRYSSIGMILLGIVTFLFSGFLGLVLIVIGVVMYWFYRSHLTEGRPSSGSQAKKGAS